jgi:hypothetical protein
MRVLRPTTITDSVLTSTNIVENEYATWVAGTTYALNGGVIKNHKIYISTAGSNVGHDPEEAGSTWWSYYSHTNAWKMFDGKVGAQSSRAESINIKLTPGRITGITLLNVDALEVQVIMTDPGDGEVLSTTISTITSENITDLYSYFFEPFLYNKNIFIDTPVFGEATVDINIIFPSGTAKVGEIVIGNALTIGCTQFGAGVSITDYSVKEVDDFGNYAILQRAFSKRGNFSIELSNNLVGATLSMFEEYRAAPVVWIPTTAEYLSSPMIVYGYYRDFEITANYYNQSSCSISLEGLT